MYKFLVWTTAISLAPASMTGLLLGGTKQSAPTDLSPEPIPRSTPAALITVGGAGGLQDRKVISTGSEVWGGVERRSAGRRVSGALHNALYTPGGCQTGCSKELSPADRASRSHNAISF